MTHAELSLLQWIASTTEAGGGRSFSVDDWAGPVLTMADMPFRPLSLDASALLGLDRLGYVRLVDRTTLQGELTDAGLAWGT